MATGTIGKSFGSGFKFDKWIKDAAPPAIAILAFLLIWEGLSASGITLLPGPSSLFTDERTRMLLFYPFYDNGGIDKGMFWQTLASLGRVGISYTIAAVVGISMGIAIGTTPVLSKALDPLFLFLRTVPPLAWVPISLAALNKNEPAALFVIFITAVWPILINTAVGVKEIPQDYNNVAKVIQISRQKYFFKILLPSALPYIFTGLRVAISLSWLAIIAAEIVMSGIVGIGFFIWEAYQNNYISEVVLALLYIGMVGLLLDKFMAWLQTLIMKGQS
ncbi:nitrate ABC transporter permease [Alkalinema sp. FACHB-956]|uniref:nitrate ABC transporter permease n=1 Tax=Alkalinema sp. FACHB-956 TaxID=2692768 RepID=UPI00168A1754|nr:nitrate ABC transporter permease [Alkalinema sp. FACHB-956]MBD2326021.1 nitrate ABC transporter permease [Alkalinema sp. FACHB-956]